MVKKLAIALAVCGLSFCSAAQAKTFVGVLWPMFGPLPAIGLVELVGEIKMMPDVEVKTYLHQSWPELVQDIDRQPAGTRTVVVGYSLGANSSVFVANKAKYVDLIIALQPSMLSWNPPVKGKVGRMIEIYNPNPWMTFGGMGSKKLEGRNIEYIANNDSHPGAQFSPQFRGLVKREIAKSTAQDRLETARLDVAKPTKLARLPEPKALKPADERPTRQARATNDRLPVAQVGTPRETDRARPVDVAAAADLAVDVAAAAARPKRQPREVAVFLDGISSSVNSGDLYAPRRLTVGDMKRYAERTYRGAPSDDSMAIASD
jgi:hypothetical protein